MKVLVTGGTGFVGRNLVPALLARGHDVTVVARDRTRAQEHHWYRLVHFVSTDVHSTTCEVSKLVADADVLVHLAWPGLPKYQGRFHFESNLPGDYRFLKAALESGLRHLVVAGTCFEYGLAEGCLDEEHLTNPVTAYGLAKDTLHRFLRILQAEQPFVLQWLRLFYTFGPGQHEGSLLSQLDRAIDEGAGSFEMSGGEQLRDFQPISHVAEQMCRLLSNPQVSGAINVCSGAPISVRRLVENRLAERGAHLRLNFGVLPYPTYEPMAFWGSVAKTRGLKA